MVQAKRGKSGVNATIVTSRGFAAMELEIHLPGEKMDNTHMPRTAKVRATSHPDTIVNGVRSVQIPIIGGSVIVPKKTPNVCGYELYARDESSSNNPIICFHGCIRLADAK